MFNRLAGRSFSWRFSGLRHLRPRCRFFFEPLQSQTASPGLPIEAGRNTRSIANSPGHPTLLNQILEKLLVLQRIHRSPKALMSESKELVVVDQPAERFFDQVFAIAQIVEDLRAKDEEAPVDPEVGIVRRPYAVHSSVLIHVDKMQTEIWARGDKTCDLSALLEGLDHGWKIDVGKAITVVRKEHFLTLEVPSHGI